MAPLIIYLSPQKKKPFVHPIVCCHWLLLVHCGFVLLIVISLSSHIVNLMFFVRQSFLIVNLSFLIVPYCPLDCLPLPTYHFMPSPTIPHHHQLTILFLCLLLCTILFVLCLALHHPTIPDFPSLSLSSS
jgi:hypothetical protein